MPEIILNFSSAGFSRAFTAVLVDEWRARFLDYPVTLEHLLEEPRVAYNLMRAAGIANPPTTPSRADRARIARWFEFCVHGLLPSEEDPRPLRLGRIPGTDPPVYQLFHEEHCALYRSAVAA